MKTTEKIVRSEKVYRIIRDKILAFEIKAGETLNESLLAQEYNVSRTPIREALRKLERDNIIEINAHKGAIVKGITIEDIEGIFSVREALECRAVENAIAYISDENIKRIKDKLIDIKENNIDSSDDEGDELHRIIIRLNGNKWLTNILDELSFYTSYLKKLASSVPGQIEKANLEHLEILDCIEKRDAEKAKQKMCEHIRNSKESILVALRNNVML